MSSANRGKYAEGKVKDYLNKINEAMLNFDFERVLDAHAAGGRFQSRTGDFTWWAPELHGVIEVKEVEHAFRLPYKNVSTESIAKLVKRQLAGGQISILVCHQPMKLWRAVPLERLRERDKDTPSGSWDLSDLPTHKSVMDALANTDLAL